jgi:hypothetical protein
MHTSYMLIMNASRANGGDTVCKGIVYNDHTFYRPNLLAYQSCMKTCILDTCRSYRSYGAYISHRHTHSCVFFAKYGHVRGPRCESEYPFQTSWIKQSVCPTLSLWKTSRPVAAAAAACLVLFVGHLHENHAKRSLHLCMIDQGLRVQTQTKALTVEENSVHMRIYMHIANKYTQTYT